MLRDVRLTGSGEQALAQVVLDRARADAGALGQLGHLQQAVGRSPSRSCHERALALRRRAGDRAGLLQRARSPRRSSRGGAAPRRCARPAPGPGARAPPGVRESFTGTPSSFTGAARPAGRARRPSRARARARSPAPRRGRAPAPGSSRARRRTPATRRGCARGRSARPRRAPPSPGRSNCFSIRSSRPTPRHHACQNFGSSAPSVTQPSFARVGPVADEPPRQLEVAALGHHVRRRSSAPATIASHDSAPSAIETSTNWPSPERSRSRSAARIPKAAISAPPPRSAICPPDWIGGPSRSPGEAEQADQPEVVHVVAGACGVGPVLAVAGDGAVDEARVLLAQARRSRRRGGRARRGGRTRAGRRTRARAAGAPRVPPSSLRLTRIERLLRFSARNMRALARSAPRPRSSGGAQRT